MIDKDDLLDCISSWPDYAKAELLGIAREIDANLQRGVYVATPAELAGIDAGLADVAKGNVVGFDEIEWLFEEYRPKGRWSFPLARKQTFGKFSPASPLIIPMPMKAFSRVCRTSFCGSAVGPKQLRSWRTVQKSV